MGMLEDMCVGVANLNCVKFKVWFIFNLRIIYPSVHFSFFSSFFFPTVTLSGISLSISLLFLSCHHRFSMHSLRYPFDNYTDLHLTKYCDLFFHPSPSFISLLKLCLACKFESSTVPWKANADFIGILVQRERPGRRDSRTVWQQVSKNRTHLCCKSVFISKLCIDYFMYNPFIKTS